MFSFDKAYEYSINGRPDDWRGLFDDSSYRDNGGAHASSRGEKTAWDLFFEEQENDSGLTVTIPAEESAADPVAEVLETAEGGDATRRTIAAREVATLTLPETVEITETAA